jgi:hypothetical protein
MTCQASARARRCPERRCVAGTRQGGPEAASNWPSSIRQRTGAPTEHMAPQSSWDVPSNSCSSLLRLRGRGAQPSIPGPSDEPLSQCLAWPGRTSRSEPYPVQGCSGPTASKSRCRRALAPCHSVTIPSAARVTHAPSSALEDAAGADATAQLQGDDHWTTPAGREHEARRSRTTRRKLLIQSSYPHHQKPSRRLGGRAVRIKSIARRTPAQVPKGREGNYRAASC